MTGAWAEGTTTRGVVGCDAAAVVGGLLAVVGGLLAVLGATVGAGASVAGVTSAAAFVRTRVDPLEEDNATAAVIPPTTTTTATTAMTSKNRRGRPGGGPGTTVMSSPGSGVSARVDRSMWSSVPATRASSRPPAARNGVTSRAFEPGQIDLM
jgi:hypothetical protein